MNRFWSGDGYGSAEEPEAHFSFLRSGSEEPAGVQMQIIGE
jgi:hypothetical protein